MMVPPPPPPPTAPTTPIPPPPPAAPQPTSGRRHPAPSQPAEPQPRPGGGPPDHIRRILEARGDHDSTNNAWRTIRFERCTLRPHEDHECGQYIGIGLDDLGLTRRVDPTPLTEHGELQAVVDQIQTYTLTRRDLDPHRLELSSPRYRTAINRRPAPTDTTHRAEAADGRDYDVVAEHRCGLARDHLEHTASVHDRRPHQTPNNRPPY